jgi:TonB-dependent starch-binding outer membrane protein SusC
MNRLLNKKLHLSFIAVLCVSFNFSFGQITEIKGKVSEGGNAMSGVTIVEINQNDRQVNGSNTDKDGNYTIKISNPANRLRFSFIGFVSKTESINRRSTINIELSRDTSNNMTDVVVVGRRTEQINTGLGTTSKRDLIGSVSSVKAEVLAEQPVSSIDQMIQGRAAGVQIVSNSGEPGAGVDIRIRGAGSISGGNDPLFIIDGIAIISSSTDNSIAGQSVARINPIADLNPSDIERIDILKDANAAAIYGARAANGVVIITTKRGKPGRTDIQFTPQFTVNQAPPPIKVLNGSEYKIMRLEAFQNQGNINPLGADLLYYVDDPTYQSYQYFQNNTDWLKAITKTGFNQNYNVSVSSAGEAVRYLFTTSFLNANAPYINTYQKRFTTRFNLDYKVSDKLRFSANLFFARTKRSTPSGGFYELALKKNPSLPIYDIDVNGNPLPGYFSLPANQFLRNPVAYAETVDNSAYSTNFKPNIQLNYDIIRNLSLTSNLSLEFVGEDGSTFIPPQATGVIWNDGSFNQVNTRDYERRQMIVQNYLTYNKNFGTKFKTQFLLGNEFNTQNGNNLELQAWATASSLLHTLGSAGGVQRINSSQSEETILSNFVKGSLVYNDKYGFNATVRRDGSSKFGGNNKYANFPSFGAYWRVSSEPFFSDLDFLTDLKIRASWGQLGNSGIPNYRYISQFSPGANYLGLIGVTQQNPELNDLRWETIESTNLGVDIDLFQSRFTATIDFYNKNTKDLLFGLPVPTSSGLSGSILTNLGTIRNRGVEVQLDYNAIKGKKASDFNWNVSFNIGRNENKVTSLPGGILKNPNNYAGFGSQIKEGDPLGTYYGLVFKGVYATDFDAVVRDDKGNIVYNLDGITPKKMRLNSETGDTLRGGDAIYEDFNHDGIINDQDRVLVGNANAVFFGGLNNDFSYKSFTLKVFIQYQYGNDVINGMRYQMEKMDNNDNQAISTLRRWRKQGDITDMPRALNGNTRNSQGSTRWIEDGSYARLKFITLSYRFPTSIAKKLRMKNASAYFTGSDLFTITNYTGADPEIQIGSDPGFIGADRGLVPRAKSYVLGLNFTF